jgi:cyclase
MRVAQSLPAFRAVSEDLKPYIEPYDPNWRSPQDAMARPFYHWTAFPSEASRTPGAERQP